MSYQPAPLFTPLTVAFLTIPVLLLVAVASTPKPEPTVTLKTRQWECLEKHTEDNSISTFIDGIPITIPDEKLVCDHWIRKR